MSDNSEAIAGVGLFVAAYVDENGAKQGHEDLKQAKKMANLITMMPLSSIGMTTAKYTAKKLVT